MNTMARRRGRTPTNEAKAFRTLLSVLCHKRSTRSQSSSRRYYSSATISRTAWQWAEDGTLQRLWRAYLDGLPSDDVRRWLKIFEYYRESWKNRSLANRWAGRVHTKWFKLMDQVLQAHRR